MIMEDFVNFELSKKLKEKGFREECFAHYPICGEDYEEYNCIEDDRCGISLFDLCRCYNNEDSRLIDAPTISQVLKWLREEKNILLAPNPACFKEDCCLGWDCDVWAYGNYNHCCVDYKTYEKASIAGIEYVIDNLI